MTLGKKTITSMGIIGTYEGQNEMGGMGLVTDLFWDNMRQEIENISEQCHDYLRDKAPYKKTFDDESKDTNDVLNIAGIVDALHGTGQLISSGVSYVKLNKPYSDARVGNAVNNAELLEKAIGNVNRNQKGVTLGINGGNAGKYISDVNKELKN